MEIGVQKNLVAALTFLSIALATIQGVAKPLILSVPSQFDTLDPTKTWSFYQQVIINSTYSTLTKVDAKGRIVGNLVENWAISKDLLTYRFTLKNNVKFHDGTPLTSQDVAYSLSRHLWPSTGSRFRNIIENVFVVNGPLPDGKNLPVIKIKNDHEFTIQLFKPYPPLINFLSQPALSIVKKGKPHIGSGPLVPKYQKKDKTWSLNQNLDYFGTKSIVKSILVKTQLNSEDVFKDFEKKSVDVAIGAHLLNKTPPKSIQTQKFDSLSFNHFLINPSSKKLSDANLRAHLSQSLQEAAWKTTPAFARNLNTILPRGVLPPTYYRPNGLPDQKLKKLKAPSSKLKILYVGRHFSPGFKSSLSNALKAKGFKFELKALSGPEYMKEFESNDFDLISFPFISGYNDPDGFMHAFHNISRRKGINSDLKKAISHIKDIRHTKSVKDRLNSYSKVMQEIRGLHFVVPLYQLQIPVLSQNQIEIPSTKFRNTIELWQIKEGSK